MKQKYKVGNYNDDGDEKKNHLNHSNTLNIVHTDFFKLKTYCYCVK